MVLAGLAAFGLLYAPQPVLPQLAQEYGVRPTAASLAVSASTGALALSVVPVVLLARRWGRARVMLWGLVAAVALTVAAALAPGFGLLVVLRVLAGVALAAVVGVAMGHVGAEVHPVGLAPAMGLYVAGNSLGGVSGRLVTSGVTDVAGWRWGVLALAGVAAVVTLLFWRALPPTVAEEPERDPDAARRASWPRPEVWLVAVLPFTLMGGFVAVYNYLGFRLSEAPFSLAPGVLGLVFLAYLAGSASSAVAGRAAGRWGRPGVLAVAVLVMLGGLALTLPDRLWLVVLGLVVFTTGFFAAHATASGWAPAVAGPGPGRGSQASAVYVAAYYAGSSLFGLLLGEAWTLGGWPGVALGVGVLAGTALLAALALVRRLGRRPGTGSRSPSVVGGP